jgi:hypothetical protein
MGRESAQEIPQQTMQVVGGEEGEEWKKSKAIVKVISG